MTIWIDAQLSPSLAEWITDTFGVSSQTVRDLGLREAKDFPIFQAARQADVVVLTKDVDFPHLVKQHGPPPRVLWLTCGDILFISRSASQIDRVLQYHFS
uniref:Predicted nuclease, contains PIN domain, potential toxin-antitoxin system component n=1 Tax=Candidatus Kentrum sp. MB TaxID=2138164 RepID=A0A450XRZ0_9GAMM|nr:MAG: Predicted nuclease, contains PIN domain, potential toxin-antitoxin system component [Candidatus Kentron sp. MB]VFK35122.1 MAG: Predicted nuclease, contains PIN domain, potential toxin-antitoxin system component [Candidatus Kentron sp. MB]VFK76987.1 MAG: Predicted nuclease, contains PIN domain, potential toxin-antitoxin system component [Candidatus Kentron sp. MB]